MCVPDPIQPPSPAPTRTPSGTITVADPDLGGNRPLRNARVVAKRFLKIERTYTNNQGQFFLNKEFNKVRIIAKMKNDQSVIRGLRRARLWQMLIPVDVNFGKFRGTLNNLSLTIAYSTDARSEGAKCWAAATANNNVQEYRDFATQQGIGLPPTKLKVLLTNWKYQENRGATPLFAKRAISPIPNPFTQFYILGNAAAAVGGFGALSNILSFEIDISSGYNNGSDGTVLSSLFSETMLHECAHAAHYAKVGNTWYGAFFNAELSQIVGSNAPYGNGSSLNAGHIALGEGWAYHVGHFMANLKYGGNAARPTEQGIVYGNGGIFESGVQVANSGLPQHLNLLEDFSSRRTGIDPFYWIPQGLYYDLIDNRNDNNFGRVPLVDNVLNFTNLQFFNAIDADVKSMPEYRVRLLSENGNNQAAGVNTIFAFYGY